MLLLIEQVLNGLQLGFMLFLLSAGLTLVFGVMNLINLAHGSFYMVGAYVAATVMQASGSFLLALLVSLGSAALCGLLVEIIVLRHLYHRDGCAQPAYGTWRQFRCVDDSHQKYSGYAPARGSKQLVPR